MKRITHCILLVTLFALPAYAAGPLAFLAKDLVTGIVRSFVEGQYHQALATAGPCGTPLAPPGAAGLAGMWGGRGAMPGVPSLAGVGGMRAGKSGIPSVPGAAGGGATPPPGMSEMMNDQMAQAQAMMAKEQARGANAVPGKDGVPAAVPDMAAMMQTLQQGEPLSNAEVDELATLLERTAKAVPSAAPKCAPGDMKLVLQTAAGSPMGGGILRMMLGSMRDMQRKLDEARATFARMSEPERNQYVETMAAEFRGWPKESQQALLGMVETNFLGMPDAMKTQLLARLKQAA